MTRTKHGWHIPGTTYDDEKFLSATQPCGGPTSCLHCAEQCGTIKVLKDNHVLLDIEDPAAAYRHLMFFRDVVTHHYGRTDGKLEINFLEGLMKQIEEETD